MTDLDQCVPGELSGDNLIAGEVLLKIDNVSKSFVLNDGKKLPVLTDVSFTIQNIKTKPQILSILGPSGGGKTTLMRIIAGLDAADGGFAQCDENDQMCPITSGKIGVVFQKYPLFDDLNVINNLIEPAQNSGLSKKEATEKAVQFLKDFGLENQQSSYPVQLSGGQRQRVAIAQQLIQNRHYIILDEPFSGLDQNNISNVINLLNKVAYSHTKHTFIIVTHDITSALIISDRILLLGKPIGSADTIGAYVVKDYDLIEEGLAYHKNIEDLPRFVEFRREIKQVEFPKLVTRS